MRTLTLAAGLASALAFSAAPAFAQGYGHSSHGHSSHGHRHAHVSYGHGHSHHSTYRAPSYGHSHYVAPTYYAPTYVAPVYHAPKVVYVAPTTTYETKPAYVLQKVAGYCKEKVTSYGYGHSSRQTVECKAGEAEKQVEIVPVPVEPPK